MTLIDKIKNSILISFVRLRCPVSRTLFLSLHVLSFCLLCIFFNTYVSVFFNTYSIQMFLKQCLLFMNVTIDDTEMSLLNGDCGY